MNELASQRFFATALARARARHAAGDGPAAWRELRAGLDSPAEYSSAVAAAKFLEHTAPDGAPGGWTARRVALIGADTLTFFRPIIRALAFRDGWWPVFYEAPFGAWRQEILDPNSALRRFRPEVTLLLRGWHSAGAGGVETSRLVDEELGLAQRAKEGLGLVLWPGYDLPEDDAVLRATLVEVNARLRAALPPGLIWADLAEAQSAVGENWMDQRLWEAVRLHPSPLGCVAVVELWLSLLRFRWGQTRKVLVTDLDNVLWGGIVGEDGVAGLRLGPGSPGGEAHAAYQRYLLELKERGVMLAVCSKNNEADVREVFAQRAIPLKREDFTGWMVNWNDKAENLRALAAHLQLGLDSFVFVDDQPAERARVRAALPEVAVPELPEDAAQYVAALRARRFFDTTVVSAEDCGRAASYRAVAQSNEWRATSATLDDFLRSLEMTGEQGAFSEATLDRAEQLLSRSNQWNLTTRRHSRAEITALLARPGVLARWFRLRDRFGDHGLVGLWIMVSRGEGEWEIDSWVMSCRVIGRGLEDWMFNEMVSAARGAGGRRLHGVYLPTAKNGLVAGLLPGYGFVAGGKTDRGEPSYTLDLTRASERPHWIRPRVGGAD